MSFSAHSPPVSPIKKFLSLLEVPLPLSSWAGFHENGLGQRQCPKRQSSRVGVGPHHAVDGEVVGLLLLNRPKLINVAYIKIEVQQVPSKRRAATGERSQGRLIPPLQAVPVRP